MSAMHPTLRVVMVRHAVSACGIATTVFSANQIPNPGPFVAEYIYGCHGFDMHPSSGI